jgi:putative Ca2+/H+ antiporter (TMEM165/GDT1 family)
MKKNYAKVIVLVMTVMMMVVMLASCGQDSEVRVEERNNDLINYEIVSISSSAYYVSSIGPKTCIVVVAINAENNVYTKAFYGSEIRIIDDGEPHLLYEEKYGGSTTYLCITREDLYNYLNH